MERVESFTCLFERKENGLVVCSRCGEPWPEQVLETEDITKYVRICKERRDVGLGDTLARFFRKIGIFSCRGCRRRQSFLNKIFPYKRKRTQVLI